MSRFKVQNIVRKQTGVALVVSLLLLLTFTVLGVAGTRIAVQQDKMASIFVDLSTSFDHAESLRMVTGNILKVLMDDSDMEDAAAALSALVREEDWAEELEEPLQHSNFAEDAGNGAMTVFRVVKNHELSLPWTNVSTQLDPFFSGESHRLANQNYKTNLANSLAQYQYVILRPPSDFALGGSDISIGKPQSVVYWILVRNIERADVILFNKFVLYRGSNDA